MNKYYIFTLGCQMNIEESQKIAKKLDKLGYKSAAENEADLIIINACSVRQHAVDRIWGKIKNWQKINKKIYITGCILDNDKKILKEKNIEIFRINNIPKILNIKNNRTSKIKIEKNKIAYITIMTGCDNFCSYCVVPYTRGREKSRSMKEIIKEVKQAINSGSKNIMLLGQNVNSYGIKSEIRSTKHESNNKYIKINKKNQNEKFIQLLHKIDSIDGDFKFSFMSSNPHDMGDELIKTFGTLKKWTRELHLAMQSGDDEILKSMNRKYSSKQYLALISKIKDQKSKIKISTDIIVGYPGENKEQFNNTVEICKKVRFAKAYVSKYSERPGTASSRLDDDVSQEEKKRRWKILDQLINK